MSGDLFSGVVRGDEDRLSQAGWHHAAGKLQGEWLWRDPQSGQIVSQAVALRIQDEREKANGDAAKA